MLARHTQVCKTLGSSSSITKKKKKGTKELVNQFLNNKRTRQKMEITRKNLRKSINAKMKDLNL
jgi:hypothetical protein